MLVQNSGAFLFSQPGWALGTIFALVCLALAIIVSLTRPPALRPKPIMTPNEAEFDHRLRLAFPDLSVWPQVPLLAIMEPKSKKAGSPSWQRAFRAISNRRADWVLARNGDVIAIIELDDRTHNRRADRKRDRILASCGYQVLRFESKKRPSIQEIRQTFNNGTA